MTWSPGSGRGSPRRADMAVSTASSTAHPATRTNGRNGTGWNILDDRDDFLRPARGAGGLPLGQPPAGGGPQHRADRREHHEQDHLLDVLGRLEVVPEQ